MASINLIMNTKLANEAKRLRFYSILPNLTTYIRSSSNFLCFPVELKKILLSSIIVSVFLLFFSQTRFALNEILAKVISSNPGRGGKQTKCFLGENKNSRSRGVWEAAELLASEL